jgi:hypothetical protein
MTRETKIRRLEFPKFKRQGLLLQWGKKSLLIGGQITGHSIEDLLSGPISLYPISWKS